MVEKRDSPAGRLALLLAEAMGEAIRCGTERRTAGLEEDCDRLVETLEKALRLARDIRADMGRESGRNQ